MALAELTGDEAQIDLLEQKVESTKELLEITREWLDGMISLGIDLGGHANHVIGAHGPA